MNKTLNKLFSVIAIAIISTTSIANAMTPGIALVGKGKVAGSGLDSSGLTGNICQASNAMNCVPQAILGGFGSDITYTGHDNVFLAAPDRGPFDGLTDVPYLDRFYFLHITTGIGEPFPNISTVLLDTRFFKNELGERFVGSAGAFDADPFRTLRFDPEGIRVGANGNFYVSDEYGPYLLEFDRQGNLVRRLNIPAKFLIANPSSDPAAELLGNMSGRQANRGMEGLAISPDGSTLFGIMQNALLQDHALSPGTTDRISVFTTILKLDIATGETSEYVYQLDASNRGQGVSEILAINDHEFLVVERDNRSWLSPEPQAPTRKNIYRINLNGATDVSGVEGLPAAAPLPMGTTAVTKSLFINLLDAEYGLNLNNGNAIAEKIEGLAWGPDLADGSHMLYVVSDNDLNPSRDTQIFAFSISDSLIDYQRQFLPGPLYPRGQIKRALGH